MSFLHKIAQTARTMVGLTKVLIDPENLHSTKSQSEWSDHAVNLPLLILPDK